MKHTLVILGILLSTQLQAQFEVFGVVKDLLNDPIPGVNIYISGSSIGTITDKEGNFKLSNINPGQYELIISHINYDLKVLPIEIKGTSLNTGSIQLSEKVFKLKSVVVSARRDKKWKKHYKWFKDYLLGDNYKNKYINIPDFYNADFNVKNKTITPAYPFSLNIINTYTGYEIYYAVDTFSIDKKGEKFILGYPRFKELQAKNSEQEQEWKQNRFNSYRGSLRHFFKAIIDDELSENGFHSVLHNLGQSFAASLDYKKNKKQVKDEILIANNDELFREILDVSETANPEILRITIPYFIDIYYTKELGEHFLNYVRLGKQSTLHAPEGYIDVYKNGTPVSPASFYTFGNLATEGLYESLPSNYSFTDADADAEELTETNLIVETGKKLFDHVTKNPVEKVYLHLAKPYLAKNEIMWFQAYVVAGPEHVPTTLSQNLTVELLDENLKKIDEQELYIENGMATGDFLIADSLKSNAFFLRAYTDWMLNFDEDFIELRKFEIVDETLAKEQNQPDPLLRFFPEGGDLVNGLTSELAIEYNLGKEGFEGEIRNQEGELISTFAGQSKVGKVSFTPEAGESYYATVENHVTRFDLPQAKESGIVLSVKNDTKNGQLYMSLKTKEPTSTETGHLLIHTRGLVQYYEKIVWNSPFLSLNVPTELIEDGLSHITYFNEEIKPMAERLIFKKEQEKLKVDISLEHSEFDLREEVNVFISIDDREGIGQLASASVSVIDLNQINPEAQGQNIQSNLLLSSDITGGLSNSLQYLTNDTEKLAELDLLLMTKGWRRFNWEDIEKGKFNIRHSPKVGFTVNGQVTLNELNLPTEERNLYHLGWFKGSNSFQEQLTSESGQFNFQELKYYQSNSFIHMNKVTAETKINFGRMQRLYAGNPQSEIRLNYPSHLDQQSKNLSAYVELQAILDSAFYRDLGTVIVESNRYDDIRERQSRGRFYMAGQYSISVTDLMKKGHYFSTPLHVLMMRVPGFQSRTNIPYDPFESPFEVYAQMKDISPALNQKVLFLIDDNRATFEDLMFMNPIFIDRIEVSNASQALYEFGMTAESQVIAIYTKTPEELREFNSFMAQKRTQAIDFEQFILPGGYYASRTFYAPNYSVAHPDHDLVDYRNLIHWETNIRTDANGNYSFSFYNADLPTEGMIILEGVTDAGVPFSATRTFTVKK